MNAILKSIIEVRNGHYVHALEVSTVYDLENCIESIAGEFPNESKEVLKDFFNSMEIYYLEDPELNLKDNEINENDVYNFNFDESIDNNL